MSATTTAKPAADAIEPEPPFVKWLKIAVVVMGIMIVVGVLVVIGRIVYLASTGPRQAASPATAARIVPSAGLGLPAGSTIRQVSLSGDRLAVHYEAPTGAAIAILDLATGQVLSRITVVPEVPR